MKPKKFFRICPICKNEIGYTLKFDRDKSEKLNKRCKSCAKKGELNSFFKKNHTEETKNKIKNSFKTSKKRIEFVKEQKTTKYKELISKKLSGKKNPAYKRGKLKDLWFKKYGLEIANQKDLEWKKKLSQQSSGINNNMYGKPSPIGSGNGWSGWYNNWFFRSLLELSFMIKVIERFKFQWESGEQKKYKITYLDFKGKNKNYFPDFILNNKYMVECKPKNLQNSLVVQFKAKAALEFCFNNNMKYKLISPYKLNDNEIIDLYNTGKIKFLEKYEVKFKRLYKI